MALRTRLTPSGSLHKSFLSDGDRRSFPEDPSFGWSAVIVVDCAMIWLAVLHVSGLIVLSFQAIAMGSEATKESTAYQVHFSKEDLKQRLTPEQYHVTQEQGTERAFTGDLWDNHKDGKYRCAVCGKELFLSDAKFNSGSGWPSFYKEVTPGTVDRKQDSSQGMTRTEVTCSHCGAHLGHLFDDGPQPTGLRYCINSASLKFQTEDNSKEAKSEL